MNDFKQLKRNLKRDTSSLKKIKVSLLGDSATQFLAVALRGEAIERDIVLDLFEAEYNQVERQVLDPSSELYEHNAEYTIVFQSTHKLLETYSLLSIEQQGRLAEERLDFVRTLCNSIGGRIIYYNYPEIDNSAFGSYSNKVQNSFVYQLRKLNFELMKLSQELPNLFICDIASLQNEFGRKWLFDSAVYVNTEMLLSIDALPFVASRTMDILCALQGQFKKCLILDLDNTLWGGVVGDDGWEGIQIGHGLGIGKAFTEFQEWVRVLKNRGIIIAICSKNDEAKAKEAFVKNPEMVLKLDDISVFVANWENKADNIRTIQKVLNIGFDSMVFIDDNPFERNLVRESIPQVTVPEMPEDPGEYLEYLYSLNLFETASYSSNDSDRTRQYQVEAQRMSESQHFANEEDFLKSLNMKCEVTGFNAFNIPRVAQLSQRSNQFNLRTIRYTEEEIRAMEISSDYATFSFALEDKFGDNGLICVVIMKSLPEEQALFVDTWFMSCRVLKRGMEHFTLNTIVEWAKEHNYKKIIGEYLPTKKNEMVAQHYPSLGFDSIGENRFVLEVETYQPLANYITKK